MEVQKYWQLIDVIDREALITEDENERSSNSFRFSQTSLSRWFLTSMSSCKSYSMILMGESGWIRREKPATQMTHSYTLDVMLLRRARHSMKTSWTTRLKYRIPSSAGHSRCSLLPQRLGQARWEETKKSICTIQSIAMQPSPTPPIGNVDQNRSWKKTMMLGEHRGLRLKKTQGWRRGI